MRKSLFMVSLLALAMTACVDFDDNPSTPVEPPTPETPVTPDEPETPALEPTIKLIGVAQGECVMSSSRSFHISFSVTGAVTNATDEMRWGIEYRFSEESDWTARYADAGVTEQTIGLETYVNSDVFDDDWNLHVYYRPFIKDDDSTIYGEDSSYIVWTWNPELETVEASNITTIEATIAARAGEELRNLDYRYFGFMYGTEESSTNQFVAVSSNDYDRYTGDYSVRLPDDLSGSTTYYYRAAVLVGQKYYVSSSVKSFTTNPEPIPTAGWAIDLGLSVEWASYNVGASSPEELGGKYAWGETSEKSEYTVESSIFQDPNNLLNYVDLGNKIVATCRPFEEYDVATVLWGSSWHMPDASEINELVDNCTWEWTKYKGVKGMYVTGPNGNSIFLPQISLGYLSKTTHVADYYFYGDVSGSGLTALSCILHFVKSGASNVYDSTHYPLTSGYSVRPVKD